jgi:hypothetical protein
MSAKFEISKDKSGKVLVVTDRRAVLRGQTLTWCMHSTTPRRRLCKGHTIEGIICELSLGAGSR